MSLKQTYTGKAIDVLNFKESDVDIVDIAHSLSLINRFGGHAPRPYSVARHCYIASKFGYSNSESLGILLHDASEAYLGDVVRPIKSLDIFNKYREIESQITGIINKKFGIDTNILNKINLVDDAMLYSEALLFFPINLRPFVWGESRHADNFRYDYITEGAIRYIKEETTWESDKLDFLSAYKFLV